MKFYNFHLDREEGFSTSHWYAPSLNNWRQDRLPFINFKLQLNTATYNRLKFRIANLNFTFLFEFGADFATKELDRSCYTLLPPRQAKTLLVVGGSEPYASTFEQQQKHLQSLGVTSEKLKKWSLFPKQGFTVKEAQEGAITLVRLSNELCKNNGELDD
jgi:hypothetical protein